MKVNKIELVKDYDENGYILDSEIYVSPLNTKLEIVWECLDTLSKIENGDSNCDIHTVTDLVVRIYNNQFTKKELLEGLDAVTRNVELIEQITFVASGQGFEMSGDTSNTKIGKINSWEDSKNNIKKFVKDMMKEGKDINNLMDMPFSFFMEIVDESNKKNVKKSESMIDAFM
ncbi:hypothetical protein CW747_02320 [Staphylococcus shinii]|nr:hypothetical protein [Staphylococcus shinii]PKI10995.1 hypothetical protein CW747_02320 [Staphylococcus shinii]